MKTFRDGREVLDLTKKADRFEYQRRTLMMVYRQNYRCPITGVLFGENNPATFDHQDGRGMGGSRRDDRIEKDGQWYNAAVSMEANITKGSKRYSWQNGEYLPV